MLAALIALGLVWLAPQDAFVAQRDAAAARNPGSPRFTVAFAGERRAFRPGEPIPVVLSYDDLDGEDPHHFDRLSQWDPIKVVTDPTDDVAWPDDFERALIYEPRGVCCAVRGGLAGGTGGGIIGYRWDGTQAVPILAPSPPPPPKPPPTTGTVVLNQIVRFDRAGRYRIYVTDGHAAEIDHSMGRPGNPPLVSNILELEITARDPQWEAQTASDAIAVLASSADGKARTDAARTLRFLGTDRAVDEMVLGLSRWSENEESREDNSQYVRGLFAARDRARVIARLEAALDDPRRLVSWLHLRTLAALRVAATEPPPGAFNPAHKRAALNAVVVRRERSLHKAGILDDDLSASFGDYAPVPEGEERPVRHVPRAFVSPAIAEFPQDVEIALRRLPAPTQRAVLDTGGANFLDRRFVPMLVRFAGAEGADGPVEPAVRILTMIAPSVARRIILEDLARLRPRLGVATTRVIPDRTLPALDAVFMRQLRTARDAAAFSAAMDRIARFATVSSAKAVERAYTRHPEAHSCEIAIPALAFFFRADPAFARQETPRVWRSLNDRDAACDYGDSRGVFLSIAAAGMSPALENAAVAALRNPDAALAADAAAMLADFGSSRAEARLWEALEAWHDRWSGRKTLLYEDRLKRSWDATLSENLVEALVSAVAWRLDEADYRRLEALCLSTCQGDMVRRRQDATEAEVAVFGLAFAARPPRYMIDGRQLMSRVQLHSKLLQFSRGTSFRWYAGDSAGGTGWEPDGEDREFARVDRFLRAHGMSLRRR